MFSFFVVPFVISVDDQLRMEDGFELKKVNDFPLQDGVQGFTVGIVLWCELLNLIK